jgi:hypothetical protein
MTNQHPITPPPELVQQWCHEDGDEIKTSPRWYQIVATKAARWGADQELQACINFVYDNELCDPDFYNNLRAARRPKPPSLKKQALTALHAVATGANDTREQHQDLDTIRRAIEALPND